MSTNAENVVGTVSISTLLKRLSTLESARSVSAAEIAAAVALIFSNSLSPVQFGVLLWALHTTALDHSAEVLAACASSMRANAAQVDAQALHAVVKKRGKKEGAYGGGLVSELASYSKSVESRIQC
jgi:anthranilate phosphoribosyltransferase